MEYTVANVKEENIWEEGVYQIEVTDPVVGGVDGISNKQAKQLANRTSYLKEKVDALTPAKIFEEIKKIDGTDSGLDADKLDGLDSSSFAKLDSTQIQYFTGDIGAGRSSNSNNEGGELRLKAAPMSGFIDSAIDVYSPQRGVQNIRILQPDMNGSPKILTMPAVDGTVWSSGNMGAGSGLDADKLDGLDSSAFARIEHTLVKRGLPKGDYRSVGFWRTVEAGWYSYNHDSIQGSNNPSAYGIIHVIKDGNDFNILWYRKGTAEIYRAGFNGSLAENSTIGWNIIAASLTTGSYPDTAVLRDGNGDFAGRRVSAIHIAASVHVASQASPTIDLSRADNFEITLTGSGVFTLLNGIKGQSGVITISNAATNITGYASNIKWRTTPTNLQATETFAYFVWHDGYISIGRV